MTLTVIEAMVLVEGEVVVIITRGDKCLAGEEAHHRDGLQGVLQDVLQGVTIIKVVVIIGERNLAIDLKDPIIVLIKNLTFLIQTHIVLGKSINLQQLLESSNIEAKRVALDLDLGHLQYHNYDHQDHQMGANRLQNRSSNQRNP